MHQIEVNLPVSFIKEDNRVVAYTPALDISTAGKNEAEAKSRFEELVNIFFADLIQNNTVEPVLTELGWVKEHQKWSPPVISQESLNIKIPALV